MDKSNNSSRKGSNNSLHMNKAEKSYVKSSAAAKIQKIQKSDLTNSEKNRQIFNTLNDSTKVLFRVKKDRFLVETIRKNSQKKANAVLNFEKIELNAIKTANKAKRIELTESLKQEFYKLNSNKKRKFEKMAKYEGDFRSALDCYIDFRLGK